ncbi:MULTISPECIES: hypothetical protein [unclassified Pantoea]|uniref:hypothetical protein n=1 Tax=unclassified Pantoea TaxID=2630326 RepID=UPI002477B815|nr:MULTISPECIES: hypothetical protein [unclassified Pantoea]GME39909.1 hypothetical protein ACJ1_23950 [Pantoea sp. QMID1]GME40492.1 hypothetical protein ACJ3_25730 [Pantoea sp. QMID3]GME54893.1 hypothetical protein ACJ4_17700 [Pantoea sp. QMID4]GME55893.1 hypothetical protein ACJ2_17730 [Pantoea sp. QMID2]
MKEDVKKLMSELATNKSLQNSLAEIEVEPEAYHHFANLNGYICSIYEIQYVFKDMVWFARIGDDIDHA